ncbi:MAG: type II toxin-antitoxin system VapC family toxin [Isosphaerales bacterium]
MADYFLDTSAVVKRYVQETGTAWIRNLAAPSAGHFIYLAGITEVEVTSALARRRGQPGLSVAQARGALGLFRQDLAQDYRIAEITVPLLQRAALLADLHALRGYDAVQLAAALDVRSQVPALILASADADLNTAAAAEGLPVENPNTHP